MITGEFWLAEKKYFTGINYSLGNEDTTLEYEICRMHHPKNIFSIAGSGGRCLPLLAHGGHLTICDLSSEQLALVELRMATYDQLSYQDYLRFWGLPPYGHFDYRSFRKKVLNGLSLKEEVRKHFEQLFGEINYESILYLGRWERTFKVLSMIAKRILGSDYNKILQFDNLEDQRHYYLNDFPLNRWRTVIFLLGNRSVFNALLYKGDFVKKNIEQSYYDFYFSAFDRLFKDQLVKKSFFVNLCLEGELAHEDAIPLESRQKTFEEIKASGPLKGRVTSINKDLFSALNETNGIIDFASLSDVPSYFDIVAGRSFMNQLSKHLAKDAIVVVRYYLHVCDPDLGQFEDVTTTYSHLIKSECVQMYRIKIYKFIGKQ